MKKKLLPQRNQGFSDLTGQALTSLGLVLLRSMIYSIFIASKEVCVLEEAQNSFDLVHYFSPFCEN